MPISFETTQTIEQPIDRVFSFLCNFANMPLWNYYIQTVTKISEGNITEGTLFEMKRPRDLHVFSITRLDAPKKIIVELQPPGPKHQIIFELTGNDQQTSVTYKWHLELEKYKLLKYFPGGLFKRMVLSIPTKFILTKTKPAVEENFKRLKLLLETGQVTLQNGRHVVWPAS